MIAPAGIRAAVGTPRVTVSASPCASKPPTLERALRHRVGLAVGAQQRGHQQRAAEQRLGVAQRAHRHVDAAALAGERRQGGGDHHRGDVLGVEVVAAGGDAQPLEHRDQALLGEHRVAQGVAGAVEADDQPVADQHVAAHALEVGDVLDPRGRRRRRRASQPGAPQPRARRPAHRASAGVDVALAIDRAVMCAQLGDRFARSMARRLTRC